MDDNKTPECKTDPRAPHGFDRDASHNADRYVCECEGWEPPEDGKKKVPNKWKVSGVPYLVELPEEGDDRA